MRDYANMHSGTDSSPSTKWSSILDHATFGEDSFRRMHGDQLNQDWLDNDSTSMKEPVIVEQPDGLGLEMPAKDLTVAEIADSLGRDVPVEVIGNPFLPFASDITDCDMSDVSTQGSSSWTLGKWADYYCLEPSARDKVRNVISLEISGTELADRVLPPRLVREVDWVEKYWPANKKGKGQLYPKVQLYCLMGVAGAWTVRCRCTVRSGS